MRREIVVSTVAAGAVICLAAVWWRNRRKVIDDKPSQKAPNRRPPRARAAARRSSRINSSSHNHRKSLSGEAKEHGRNLRIDIADELVVSTREIFDGVGLDPRGDIFLVPRTLFLGQGKFTRQDKCLGSTMTLLAAQASAPHPGDVKYVYVCHRWENSGAPEGATHSHYHAVVRFLKAHPTITHVFVDYSCVSQQQTNGKGYCRRIRAAHLRALPLALLRSHCMLVLPKAEGRARFRLSCLREALERGWIQLEYLLARFGRIPTYVNYQFGQSEAFIRLEQGASDPLRAAGEAALESLTGSMAFSCTEQELAKTTHTARQNWMVEGHDSFSIQDLLSAARCDLSSLAVAHRRQLLMASANDAGLKAPQLDFLLGPCSMEDDRPEIIRLLLYVAATAQNSPDIWGGNRIPRERHDELLSPARIVHVPNAPTT